MFCGLIDVMQHWPLTCMSKVKVILVPIHQTTVHEVDMEKAMAILVVYLHHMTHTKKADVHQSYTHNDIA